jgi:hypothetical protein
MNKQQAQKELADAILNQTDFTMDELANRVIHVVDIYEDIITFDGYMLEIEVGEKSTQ